MARSSPAGSSRIGSTDHIDSLNPFVAFNAQSYVAFVMIYPVLVQYAPGFEFEGDWAESWETSPDGTVWTFKVKPGSWSDGTPLTAEDGAWTCNMIVQYKDGPTASLAPFLSHVTRLRGARPADARHHLRAAGRTTSLPNLQQFFILPKHVWEQYLGNDGKDLKKVKPEDSLPLVAGGAFTITKFEKKGTTIYEKNPGFYGTAALRRRRGLADLHERGRHGRGPARRRARHHRRAAGQRGRVSSRATTPSSWNGSPAFQVNNFIFNSNPAKPKNRELLDPVVREAVAYAIDKQAIADTAYAGFAKPWASIVAPPAGDWVNPDLQPEPFDARPRQPAARRCRLRPWVRRDQSRPGRREDVLRGHHADGSPGHQPLVRGRPDRARADRDRGRSREPLDDTTAFEEIGAPDWKYLEFDMAMWDWVGYLDPDFVLSVVGCDQYGGWSDTAYCNPEYDELYQRAGRDGRPGRSPGDRLGDAGDPVQRPAVHPAGEPRSCNVAHATNWDGLHPELAGFSKLPWTDAHQIG